MGIENPASRLLWIMGEGQRYPDNQTVEQVWSDLLGIPYQDRPAFFRAYAGLCEVAAELRLALSDIDVDIQLYEDTISKAEAVIKRTNNFSAAWGPIKTKITSDLIVGLRYVEDTVQRRAPLTLIREDDVEQLIKSVDELIQQVEGADLEPALTHFYLHNLHRLLAVLQQYKISGLTGAEEVLRYSIGHAAILSKEGVNPADSRFWQPFWTYVTRAGSLAGISQLAIQAAPSIKAALESGLA